MLFNIFFSHFLYYRNSAHFILRHKFIFRVTLNMFECVCVCKRRACVCILLIEIWRYEESFGSCSLFKLLVNKVWISYNFFPWQTPNKTLHLPFSSFDILLLFLPLIHSYMYVLGGVRVKGMNGEKRVGCERIKEISSFWPYNLLWLYLHFWSTDYGYAFFFCYIVSFNNMWGENELDLDFFTFIYKYTLFTRQ